VGAGILDAKRLAAININGMDLVLLLMSLTIEIVSATSPNDKASDDSLIEIANKVEGFARQVTDERHKFLMTQFARALIGTERT
jgi:hypothetical protein